MRTESASPYLLSIDVEDWYSSSLAILGGKGYGMRPEPSVVRNTLKALELLEKTQNRATFFILGTVAEHYPDLVKEILKRGHEVGSHGYAHEPVYEQSQEKFGADLKKSLEVLHRAGASKVNGYRAPYWSITRQSLWAIPCIAASGFVYDSSIFPIARKLYGIADAPRHPYLIHDDLWEFPAATAKLGPWNFPIAGGGYLRLLPYDVLSFAIKRGGTKNPSVFYFHTYELDPSDIHSDKEKASKSSWMRSLEQKIGRKSNPEKIQRLLSEFKFTTIESAWSRLQKQKEVKSEPNRT